MTTPDAPAVATRLAQVIARRHDEMVRDLARFVAIPTGKNHTAGLDEFRGIIIDRLAALGATSDLIPGDDRPDWLSPDDGAFVPPPTARVRRTGAASARILIAGHLDTVFDPLGPFQTLEVSSDGKTAVGPGVVDMKGGILIALVALEALAEVGCDPTWTFLLNSDEEMGSYCSYAALHAEATRHDWGLALEPALPDGSLAVERKGSGQFMIETIGRAAHAGREFEKGVSAVYALAHVLTQVEKLSDSSHGITVNVGPISGGIAPNIVPDRARAWGNVRFPSTNDAERLGRAFDAQQTDADALPRVIVRRSFNRPAKPLTDATRRLAELAQETAHQIGQHLPFASTGGVCDGNILQDAGLATIDTLGVRGDGLHTQEEWIELDSLTERAVLLASLINRLSEH